MSTNLEILKFINKSEGVSIDTRTLEKGQVFFALAGDNFDGNKFVKVALEKGALLAVASDKKFSTVPNVIVVDNTLKTLQNVAELHRDRLDIPIIGLTGTNGKTTTKELLCKILSSQYNVLCTAGNLNNHIGVPLTLLKLTSDHQLAVVEMGASGHGEIDFLCNLAKPTHGLITSIGIAHIEGFGSLQNIIKTKLELYHYLKERPGAFFYNNEIIELKDFVEDYKNLMTFSFDDMKGKNIYKVSLNKTFLFLDLNIILKSNKVINVKTNLYGEYNFMNIVNAIKISDYFDISVENIKKGLENYISENNRSQIVEWNSNKLIMDAYNANPTSMKLALQTFENTNSEKDKYLVLGDMLELGNVSLSEHLKILKYLLEKSFYKKCIFIGKEFIKAMENNSDYKKSMFFVENVKDAKKIVEQLEIRDSMILVKASRGIKAESIFE
jgi:UDP-N-acetylmuramoyl-tripeptide--D-alanyl-D-alanine ligase